MARAKSAAKHAAVYLRVSSKGQDTASQEPDLKRWAQAQDQPVVFYRDKFTGKTMDRPGFTRLWADVEAGKVSRLVCWRLDRLGRTAKGLTALFEDLRDRKVNLVSLKDGLDLSTAAGRLMANVLASVAAYETEVRAERIRAGQDVARAAGKHLGRPPGIRTPIKVKSEQHELVRRMKSNGERIASIARATGLSRVTIYRILNRHNDTPTLVETGGQRVRRTNRDRP
jgi:DNA invertase Pin-like site-specific DNA recombinase